MWLRTGGCSEEGEVDCHRVREVAEGGPASREEDGVEEGQPGGGGCDADRAFLLSFSGQILPILRLSLESLGKHLNHTGNILYIVPIIQNTIEKI